MQSPSQLIQTPTISSYNFSAIADVTLKRNLVFPKPYIRRRRVNPALAGKVIALDTETTGIFLHKGCSPFTVTTCDMDGETRLWRWRVDPYTRQVYFVQEMIDEIRRVLYSYDTIVFHNANFDIQALNQLGFSTEELYDNFIIHDTMIMSHVFKSSNLHGLKENALHYANMLDTDEKELSIVTQQARDVASKQNPPWSIAKEDSDEDSLKGLTKTPYKCDYWVPRQLAEYLNLPTNHPWRETCDKYATLDAVRTMSIYILFTDILQGIPNNSAYGTSNVKTGFFPSISYSGTLYDKYEEARHLIEVLIDMQDIGLPTKPRALSLSLQKFRAAKEQTLKTLRDLVEEPSLNIDSPIQLQRVLYKKIGFDAGLVKRGQPSKDFPEGAPSTDKDSLGKLMASADLSQPLPPRFTFLAKLKEYRREKATLQYLEGYHTHSSHKNANGILHTSYLQARTGTGRLSSENPNATNVAKKDMLNPFGDEKDPIRAQVFADILGIDISGGEKFSLRNVFGPRINDAWVCIDYQQFQLRIFAVVSESYELIEAFEQGKDIHNVVGCKIFNKTELNDVERTAAKAINFGLLFGAGPKKIELLAGVPGLYNMFMANFPKAKIYLDSQAALARKKGYVHTVGGYRLYVPRSTFYAASCYVIQGTEAEIVKYAMVGIHNFLAGRAIAANSGNPEYYAEQISQYRLLMMVHDELIFWHRNGANQYQLEESEPNAKGKRKKFFSFNGDPFVLNTIQYIMEESGKHIGIPCQVDAKVTTTDWATRYDLQIPPF